MAEKNLITRDKSNHIQLNTDMTDEQLLKYNTISLEPDLTHADIDNLVDNTWSYFTIEKAIYEAPPPPPPPFFLASSDLNEVDVHAQYLERGPHHMFNNWQPEEMFCIFYIKSGIAHPIPTYKTLEVLLVQEGLTYHDISEAREEDFRLYNLEFKGPITAAKQEFSKQLINSLDSKWTKHTRFKSGYVPKAPFKRDPGDYWSPSSAGQLDNNVTRDNESDKIVPSTYHSIVYNDQTYLEKLREKYEGKLLTLDGKASSLKMMINGHFLPVKHKDVIRYYNELNGYDIQLGSGDNIDNTVVATLIKEAVCKNLADDGSNSPVWNDFPHPGAYKDQAGQWKNNEELTSSEYMAWWDTTNDGSVWDREHLNVYEPNGSVKYYGAFVETSATIAATPGPGQSANSIISELNALLVSTSDILISLNSANFITGPHAEAASEVKADLQKIWVTDSDTGNNAWQLRKGPFDGLDYTTGNEVDSDRSFWGLISNITNQYLIDLIHDGYNDFANEYSIGSASDIISEVSSTGTGANSSIALQIPNYLFLNQANVTTDNTFTLNQPYYAAYGDIVYDAALQNLNLNASYTDQYWTAGLSKYPLEVHDWGDDAALINVVPDNLSGDGMYDDTPFDKDIRSTLEIYFNVNQDVLAMKTDIGTFNASVLELKEEIEYRLGLPNPPINLADIDGWNERKLFMIETLEFEILPQAEDLQNIGQTQQNTILVTTSTTFIKNQIGRTYIRRMFRLIQRIRIMLWNRADEFGGHVYIINWPDSAKAIVDKYWDYAQFGGGDEWSRYSFMGYDLDGSSTATNVSSTLIYKLTEPNADNNPPTIAKVFQYPPVTGYDIGQYEIHCCTDPQSSNYTSQGSNTHEQLKQYIVTSARTNLLGDVVNAPQTEFKNLIGPIYGNGVIIGGGNNSGTGYGGNNGGGFCFSRETLVTMADGSYKRIDEIKVGDIVKSEIGTSEVKKINVHHEMRELFALNDSKYFVTEEHPFKTQTGWKAINPHHTWEHHGVESNILEVGDILIKETGIETLKSITKSSEMTDTVYSLILDNERVYFVYDYLVHNAEELGKGDIEPGVLGPE